jgi:hypothetical protein
MKRSLFAALIFVAVILPAHSIGFYFDGGIGIGPAWTLFDGKDFVDTEEERATGTGRFKEFALELGLKFGVKPFDSIPVYIVGVLDGAGHQITDYSNDYFQFISYLIGPGLVIYPMPSFQIAASLGYSFVGNETTIPTRKEYIRESEGGLAWDISVALDPLSGNHALMLGVKFFSATNTLEQTRTEQKNFMISLFARYAFRQKPR